MHTTEQPTHAVNGASSDVGQRLDVAVIGAGQAGLAIGHFLARAGRRFMILEAGESVATAWRDRWDSLVLFTSRRYDGLPGLPFPGDPGGYPAATRWSPTSSSTRRRSSCRSGSAVACDR